MIFADKLMDLRKKNGWTQEELAEKLGVSRQSVSKWEGAQSIPDLEKILRISQLFGVTTDYLLKEDVEPAVFTESSEDHSSLRQVGMEEASEFLVHSEEAAHPLALGVALCILSPVPLLLLGALSELGWFSENLAGGIGVVMLLAIISGSVALFIGIGGRMEPYEYLKTDPFETAYGVDGMVRERRKKLRGPFYRNITAGVVLCIMSPVPMMTAVGFTEAEFPMVCTVCLLLAMVALGVYIMVRACTVWDALHKLLQEGEFSPEHKRRSRLTDVVATVYWLSVTAVFLVCCFLTRNYRWCGLIWPVAAVLYGAVAAICSLFDKR